MRTAISASRRERSSLRLVSASSIATPGIFHTERREDRRQDFAADDLARGDADDPSGSRGLTRGGSRERGGGRRHRLDMRDEIRSSFGWREPARRACEQRQPERELQGVDMPADRRLRKSEPASGARKAAVPHHLQKGAQFVPMRLAASSYDIE